MTTQTTQTTLHEFTWRNFRLHVRQHRNSYSELRIAVCTESLRGWGWGWCAPKIRHTWLSVQEARRAFFEMARNVVYGRVHVHAHRSEYYVEDT